MLRLSIRRIKPGEEAKLRAWFTEVMERKEAGPVHIAAGISDTLVVPEYRRGRDHLELRRVSLAAQQGVAAVGQPRSGTSRTPPAARS